MSNSHPTHKSVVTEIEGELVLPLPLRIAEILRAKFGDTLDFTQNVETADIYLAIQEPSFDKAVRVAREFMQKYKTAFEQLSKS
jgi:hypothetical protein